MSTHEFTLDGITQANRGEVAIAFNRAVSACYADCADRPFNTKPRKVTLEFSLVPGTVDADRTLASINATPEIKSTVPVQKLNPVNCRAIVSDDGRKLVYNTLSEDNAAQMTLDDFAGWPSGSDEELS